MQLNGVYVGEKPVTLIEKHGHKYLSLSPEFAEYLYKRSGLKSRKSRIIKKTLKRAIEKALLKGLEVEKRAQL